jgi:hypothetical protein
LRVLLTVGFPAVPFNPIQQPILAVGIVPFAVTRESQDRSFTATTSSGKANLQFFGTPSRP